jgi:copper chaperone NosL
MIISDERFAAGLVVSAARDSPPTRLFDDLGCLLEYERVRPDDEPARSRWVRAFAQDRWLRAEEARYVHASGIHSPMAFGLAAFEGDDAAAPLLEEGGGRVLDFTSLRAEFARGSLRASSSGGP